MAEISNEFDCGKLDIDGLSGESHKYNIISEFELTIRNQLSQIFYTSPDDEIFRKVLELTLFAMESQYGVFGYLDADGSLVCPYMPSDTWEQTEVPFFNLVFPQDKWDVFWNYAVKEKRTYCSNKPLLPPKRYLPINNSLTVPIIHQEKVIGLINVGDKKVDYTENDIKLLEGIANYIAPILYNELSENEMHENFDVETDVNNIAHKLNKNSDMKINYQSIFNTVAVLIIIIDHDGKIIDCNNRILDILGFNKSEILGQSMLQIVHPAYHSKANQIWSDIWRKGISFDNEFKMIKKDGNFIHVSVNFSELEPENGGSGNKIWIVQDISERKSIELKIIEERNRAEAYLDIMGHDINNLNQAITSYNELLLLKPNISDQYKKYIHTTLDQSRSITDLIINVRKLSELKRENFEFEPVDVFKVLAEAIERVQQVYPYKWIRINQSMSESEVIVNSNEMLFDVFINIISNAIKFDPHDEVIIDILHSKTDDDKYWKLEFKDHGTGVKDELKTRIFKEFEKGNESVHGSGLGLAVVHEIVKLNDGSVWVTDRVASDPIKGSNFIVLLPKFEAQ